MPDKKLKKEKIAIQEIYSDLMKAQEQESYVLSMYMQIQMTRKDLQGRLRQALQGIVWGA